MSGSKEKQAILIGYSGHGFVVGEAAIQVNIRLIGYFEKKMAPINPFSIPYLGSEQEPKNLTVVSNRNAVLGIGDNKLRRKIATYLLQQQFNLLQVVHPDSNVSSYATLAAGTFVARGAQINPLATVGKGCIINTGAIIEHECKLGDYVHVAPGAVLAGNVQIGAGSFVGANAIVKQGIIIGRNVIIGAGSVVISDIPDLVTVVGNPAKTIAR